MKKIIAFFLALTLFVGIAFSFHVIVTKKNDINYPGFGTWRNIYKYASYDSVASNLHSNSLLLFGSSEFNHNYKTPYHPQHVFANQHMDPMILGTAFSQSLTHAVSLGALEPHVQKRKAVLILSPQWFDKSGVKKEAYALRFSESNFVNLLSNENLSKDLRRKIADRSIELLKKSDPTMQQRCIRYKNVLLENKHNVLDRIYIKARAAFVAEKDKTTVLSAIKLSGLDKLPPQQYTNTPPDWKHLYKKAKIDAAKASGGNEFYVGQKIYEEKLKPRLKKRLNWGKNKSFATSPEYDDLKIFLEICKETNIEPLLVMIPVNGFWYDKVSFPKEGRDKYYENIRKMSKEYNAQLADFSKDEYTPYFMIDTVHIGWKGWVKTNESIYNFYNKQAKIS